MLLWLLTYFVHPVGVYSCNGDKGRQGIERENEKRMGVPRHSFAQGLEGESCCYHHQCRGKPGEKQVAERFKDQLYSWFTCNKKVGSSDISLW